MNRISFFFFFLILSSVLCCLLSCKKEVANVCQAQEVDLLNYLCFSPTEGHYVLQSQSDLAAFIDATACDLCDCIFQNIDIDFTTQTAIAVYTSNCGNDNREVCRNDAEHSVIYTITQSPNECFAAVGSYNLVTVPKFPDSYEVSVVVE